MLRNLQDYLPILVFLGLAIGLSLALMMVSWIRAKQRPYSAKQTPYECGFDAFDLPSDNARGRFDVQFYIVAILFIIFDIEIIFLFPWAIALQKIGWFGFSSMMVFLSVLTIGFIYEWKKGALEWH
ncbi:MAG: NADH-quinone oxidoreductase subunit A [Candidatus Paracaedibacteraceae bacterium]|nr:NADH-quinone oxidoreductase subunit A [Candidatus Paracaedibacteraceae bacterium]